MSGTATAVVPTPTAFAFADIVKVEEQEDGSVRVTGRPTQEVEDVDHQIADKGWAKQALPGWMAWSNLREMHQPSAVGVGEALTFDENDDPFITAKVIDPTAVLKVKSGVYKGFSIGIKDPVVKRDRDARNGRIIGGEIVEISLVDRPAVPTAKFELVKAAGANAWLDCQGGVVIERAVTKEADMPNADAPPIEQPGQPKGGSFQILAEDADSLTVEMDGKRYRVPVGLDSQGNYVAGTPEEIPADVYPEATGKVANVSDKSMEELSRGAREHMDRQCRNRDCWHSPVATYTDRVIMSHDDGRLTAVPIEDDGYGEPYDVEERYVPAKRDDKAAVATLVKAVGVLGKAVWTTEYVDSLPDECFAYISPGGEKKDGKTEPRSLRHLPYKDADGKPDAPHVRNALARLDQTDIPAEAKAEAKRKLEAAAKEVGVDVDDKDKTAVAAETDEEREERERKEREEAAAEKAAVALAKGAKRLCPECRKTTQIEAVPNGLGVVRKMAGGYRVIGKGACGHPVPAFVKSAEVEAKAAEEPNGAESPEVLKEHEEHRSAGKKSAKCSMCAAEADEPKRHKAAGETDEKCSECKAEKTETPDKPGAEDSEPHTEGDDAFAETVARKLAAILMGKNAGPEDTEDGERTSRHILRDLADSHDRLGKYLKELQDVDDGSEPETKKSTDPNGGPARVDFLDPKERIAPLRAELKRLDSLLDEAETHLNRDGSRTSDGPGMREQTPPERKPRGDGRLDFTAGDGKAALAALVKGVVAEAVQTRRTQLLDPKAIAADIGKSVAEVLEPLRKRLEKVEHTSEPSRVDLHPAPYHHALNPDESETRKGAVASLRERLNSLPPAQRDQTFAAMIAEGRGWQTGS